jgi:two-component system sensor histidine kinase AlgZ
VVHEAGNRSPKEQAADCVGGLLFESDESWNARRFFLHELPSDLLSCVAIGTVLTLILTPFIGIGPNRWLQSFAFNTLVSLCIGLSVSNAFRFVLPRLRRLAPNPGTGLVLHMALAIAATGFGAEAAVRSIDAIGGMRAADFRMDVFRIGFVVVTIIMAAEIAYSRLRTRARRDELSAQEARKQALHAELKALQARTNPHFLFNSLNTVAGLIEENPAGAERILEKLADLFRYALKGTEVDRVRLSEEVEAVEGYLEVEAIRLGDRLRSEVRVQAEAGSTLVPPLVLQPLVENAVLHAIAPRKQGGLVRVEAEIRDRTLVLTVTDDGDGPGSSPHRGSGTSLSELEERLELLYDGAAGFSAGATDPAGFAVRLTLPIGEFQ